MRPSAYIWTTVRGGGYFGNLRDPAETKNEQVIHVDHDCCTHNFGNHRTEVDRAAALPFAV